MRKIKEYISIFLAFFKLGSIAFGGGYTLVVLAKSSLVEKKKWLTENELINYLAMSQTLPGIIAINFAAFVGFKRAKWVGAFLAVFGIILTPMLIILALLPFIDKVNDYPVVLKALQGVKIAVCVLILSFAIQLWKFSIKKWYSILIFFATILLYILMGLSPVIPIILAGFIGYLYFKRTKRVFNQ